jgi:hypothetical protein
MDQKNKDLYLQAGILLTPGAPVSKKDLFAGRITQLSRVVSTITAKGLHPIIFGERGVGKTSIAMILKETLDVIGIKPIIVNRINCDSEDNYTSIWHKAFSQVAYIEESNAMGYEKHTKQLSMPLAERLPEQISPAEVLHVFRKSIAPAVFIFDEFDRIREVKTQNLFADTVKAISDNAIDATLIPVGVGETIDELVESHESIARSLVQIKIPRMNKDELKVIMDTALDKLSMKIDDQPLEIILKLSQGLPYYTHLIGLNSIRAALLTDSLHVRLGDVHAGIESAVNDAQHSAVAAYQSATRSSYKTHLYKEVLLACALVKGDELGYFAAADLREPLRKILNRKVDIPAFAQHLDKFCSSERGDILIKTGSRRNFRYRFRNPLLKPFVVIRGFVDGLVGDDLLGILPSWDI